MRQDSTPAPEGETPPCQCGHALNQHLLAGGHCEQRGCACRLFVIPLPPARERGEEDRTWHCEPCATVHAGDCPHGHVSEVRRLRLDLARLTRERDEAREAERRVTDRAGEIALKYDAARADLARLTRERDKANRAKLRLREAVESGGHRCASGRINRYPVLLCSTCQSSYGAGVVHFVPGPIMEALDAEAARLREALQFYANPEHWSNDSWGVRSVISEYADAGALARRALAAPPKGGQG